MAIRIDSGRTRDAINAILAEYGDAAIDAIQEASKDTAKEVVKELKKAGDFNNGNDFRKGWAQKTESTRFGASVVVYNKTKPGLAHLLEFGHAKQNGGRTKAFNFIAPINETVETKFLENFEKHMGG